MIRERAHPVDYTLSSMTASVDHKMPDLGHVENKMLRCYEVSTRVWRYQGQGRQDDSSPRFTIPALIEDAQAAKNIEERIRSLRNDNSGTAVT